MLVLSRHKSEVVFIGQDVAVMVTRISGDQVRLGIIAPEHVQIVREELAGTGPLFKEIRKRVDGERDDAINIP